MRVAIAGGHGKVGQRVPHLLREHGDEVRAHIRDPDEALEITKWGGKPVVVDVEEADTVEMPDAVEGMDAVVFAAGAGPGSGPERKWTVDYGGAVKLIAAALANDISR